MSVGPDAQPGRGELVAGVAPVLAAAEIPPSKLGAARYARLSSSERELYFWILRRFADHGRPSRLELDAAATRLGADADSALATLARNDLVHLDQGGEITVAYPFSGLPTAHRVRFPGGHQAYAMCALDALGITPMFNRSIKIASRDPESGEPVHAQLVPDGTGSWQPQSAVVVTGALHRHTASCQECCPVLNFFVTRTNAERWLTQHPEVHGYVIPIEDAMGAGRAVFGRVLAE